MSEQSPDYDADNIFSKLLRKEVAASVVFETEASLAVLDAYPCAYGHCLLIPKVNTASIVGLGREPASKLAAIMQDLSRLAQIVREKVPNTEAVNIVVNDGAAAGQMVPHLHFHVIPRCKNDGLIKHPPSKGALSEETAGELLKLLTF